MTQDPHAGFRSLLMRLDADPERAGAEFERLRRTLVKFFDWRGASWPDECADEALDRLARKLAEGVEVLDIHGFTHGIARLVLHESYRAAARQAPPDELDALPAPPSEPPADDVLARHLDGCLGALPGDARDLILTYHTGAAGRDKIEKRRGLARKLRLTENALRSRVTRLRDRLEECIRARIARSESGEPER